MIIVESAGISDVGMKRSGNEDSMFLDDEHKLYVVADGMGGHQAGEVASGLVVDTMRDYMQRFHEEDNVEELEDVDETLSKEANRLLSSVHLANLGVNKVSLTKESYRGMGATVSAAYFVDDTLIIANVGDSPIYLIHNGRIELLSVLHTVIAEQEALDPEGAKNLGREFRHMLTRAMGIKETVEPDICEIPIFKGDMVVISSDGLSDKVNPQEILDVVKKEKTDRACQTLVNMANERGGDDNVTVIVLKAKKQGKEGLGELITLAKDKLINFFRKTSN
jgi:PPM family protein phosphatase